MERIERMKEIIKLISEGMCLPSEGFREILTISLEIEEEAYFAIGGSRACRAKNEIEAVQIMLDIF